LLVYIEKLKVVHHNTSSLYLESFH